MASQINLGSIYNVIFIIYLFKLEFLKFFFINFTLWFQKSLLKVNKTLLL
jgi:hypothetical protein